MRGQLWVCNQLVFQWATICNSWASGNPLASAGCGKSEIPRFWRRYNSPGHRDNSCAASWHRQKGSMSPCLGLITFWKVLLSCCWYQGHFVASCPSDNLAVTEGFRLSSKNTPQGLPFFNFQAWFVCRISLFFLFCFGEVMIFTFRWN